MKHPNLRWGRLEISGGFLLAAAALYYLDDQGVLLWGALACALHELGHYAAIFGLGGKVSRIRLSASGAEMVLSSARPLGPGAQMIAALAGPAVNLGLALLAARLAVRFGEGWYVFAGLNLGLAGFNLLPVAQLDGGRALYSLITLLWSQRLAERVTGFCSALVAEGLVLAGVAVLWRSRGNFTLLVTALWLVCSLVRQERARKPAYSRI